MHATAYDIGRRFLDIYARPQSVIIEVGSLNVNGTLRDFCPEGARWIGLDLSKGPCVDYVIDTTMKIPLESRSADIVIASSVFEHDQFFWQTFLEMARLTKPGGIIYLNAPSNGKYHRYPVDNWRFYPDAGKALEAWAGWRKRPVRLVESFIAERTDDVWNDFVAIFERGRVNHKGTQKQSPAFISTQVACTNVWQIGQPDPMKLRDASEDMVLLAAAQPIGATVDTNKESKKPMKVTLEIEKFEHRAPHPQNMLNIFSSRWATDCEFIAPGTTSGRAPHFSEDPRPRQADQFFGGIGGKRILELGPMEGAHTWQLVNLGAREVVAVEANAEAFLKCLIVKELSGMTNARFLYGDMLEYLAMCPEGFDAIFCSGVLYHMTDPIRLVKLMCNVADQVFVWTHFIRPDHEEDLQRGPGNLQKQSVTKDDQTYDYFVGAYGDRRIGQFLGGNEDTCAWMTLDGLTQAFGNHGFDVSILNIEDNHVNGPAVTFGARRR